MNIGRESCITLSETFRLRWSSQRDAQAPLLMRKTPAWCYTALGIVPPPLSVPPVLSACAHTPHGPRGNRDCDVLWAKSQQLSVMAVFRYTYSFISLASKPNILSSLSLILTIVSENPHSHHNICPAFAPAQCTGAVLLECNIALRLAMINHALR